MAGRSKVLVVLSVLASLVAWLVPPVLAEGEGFETNTFTVASYPDTAPKWPCVARTPDGAFVVVWEAPDGDDVGVFARRYAADGTPPGDAFRVNDVTTGRQGYPSVATWEDGSFVVLWVHRPADGGPEELRARVFDAGGNPEGASFRVDETTEEPARHVGARSVAALPDGGLAATWVVGRWDGPLFDRLFDRDGTPRGESFQVVDNGRHPSIIARGEDLLVSWNTGKNVMGKLYDLAGNPRGDAFAAGDMGTAGGAVPEGRIRPSGDFVFGFPHTWWDEYIYARQRVTHVSRDGTIQETLTLSGLNDEVADDGNESWRVSPLVDRWGRLTAAFTDIDAYLPWPDRVRARRYDDDFQSLAPYFDVARLGSGENRLAYASADLDADGNVVIAWARLVSSTEGSIEARLLCSSLDTEGPTNTDACEGQRAELHAETRGRGPFSWQWRKDESDLEDGGNVSGVNTDTLVLDPVSADDAGSYDCVVHDGCPDMQTFVTPAATLTVHGAIPEVTGFMLRKENAGADLHFTWQNVENAVDYVVRQDTEPDGPFDTVTGTADDGSEGLTVPMPEGEILFFRVHGRNPGCEGP